MMPVPEEVRCVVCKSIFCCLDCRNRHELSAHNPSEVCTERNRMKCGFCRGHSTMEFQCRNDFALIMHLCQTHLPLHCKKCSTQFNSISDFSAASKCTHLNDVCSLSSNECNTEAANAKDVSNVNYVTAVHKSSFEKSISDSVISLRNYSTILHSSNHPLYKTQSPDSLEKILVRQTSTPMHQNAVMIQSPEENSQCLISSTSEHVSSINSSSDSDTSIQPIGFRNNSQGIMVTQKKTTTFKRTRQSFVGTPLTRQVMTKSIHRAILEYQHSHGQPSSPKSPLDLRIRVGRNKDETKLVKDSPQKIDNSRSSSQTVRSAEHSHGRGNTSPLETVYEQEKESFVSGSTNKNYSNLQIIEVTSNNEIAETPVLISRKLSTEQFGVDNFDKEIWFTPKEYVQSKVIENLEIYTPKVSRKRSSGRRFEDDIGGKESDIDDENSSETETKSSGSRIWSFVSTIFRLAALTPLTTPTELSMPNIDSSDTEPHMIIKRCASFNGFLRPKNSSNTSDKEDDDPLQPLKRRRITSMGPYSGQETKRIMGRPPIRRMLNH